MHHEPFNPIRAAKWISKVNKLNYCTRCGKLGKVDAAHYCGRFAHLFGKGTSRKCSDHLTAALCRDCHTHMDQYKDGNDLDRSVEFFICIARTYQALIESGSLVLR